MKYVRNISTLILSYLICMSSVAQKTTIDSLKEILSALHDTARIDCLNSLSRAYVNNERKDSALHYASLANEEAKKSNYINGIAVSYSNKAQIAKHFDDDFVQSEKYARQSLQWFEKTGNKNGIEEFYCYLLLDLLAQSKFDEGLYFGNQYYEWAKKKEAEVSILNSVGWLANLYRSRGDFEKSFLYTRQYHEIAIKLDDKILISNSYLLLAQLYQLIDNHSQAINYFRKVLSMDDREIEADRIKGDNDIWLKTEFAESLWHLGQFDSAWHYYDLFKPGEGSVYYRVYLVSTGECYLQQKKYSEALHNLLRGLELHTEKNDRNEIMRAQVDIAKVYLGQGNNSEALKYARESLSIASQTKTRHILRDSYEILHTAYDNLHKYDSAYLYYQYYIAMKDSVLNDQIKGKFAAYNYEQQIALINKEKVIQQDMLDKESLVKKILIGGLVTLSVLGLIIFRNITLKRRNEKQRLEHELEIQKIESQRSKAEFQKQATDLEMQALRAQMNPHFIFNSLNSINRFILQNNKEQASEYLTKFSRLVRLILQNSQATLITLESELEALELYLELEALRFNHRFSYKISVSDDIDQEEIKVPPLIIQPYAENAIWHGLMHKESKGHLEIKIYKQADYVLYCKITDDGIGRKKAGELKSKSASTNKSMGMRITADRIKMLHNENEYESFVIINDLVAPDGSAAGTKVIIKIPCYD